MENPKHDDLGHSNDAAITTRNTLRWGVLAPADRTILNSGEIVTVTIDTDTGRVIPDASTEQSDS